MGEQTTQQQTRVLLVDGQTVILQGDAGDNAIHEINADILQQALQEVSAQTESGTEEGGGFNSVQHETPSASGNNSLVAILQGAQGETHTVQLTAEQAEALGLHFVVGDEIKDDVQGTEIENKENIKETDQSLSLDSNNVNKVLLVQQNDTASTSSDSIMPPATHVEHSESVLHSTSETFPSNVTQIMGGPSEENQPITAHYSDGTVAYTVKITNSLQNNESINKVPVVSCSNVQEQYSQIQSQEASIKPNVQLGTSASTVHNVNSSSLASQSFTTSQEDNSVDKQKVSFIVVPGRSTNQLATVGSLTSGSSINSESSETNVPVASSVQCRQDSGNSFTLSLDKQMDINLTPRNIAVKTVTSVPATVSASSSTCTSAASSSNTPVSTTNLLTSVLSSTPTDSGMIRLVSGKDSQFIAINKTANLTAGASGSKQIGVKLLPVREGTNIGANTPLKLPIPNFNSEKPLGSSENPIQLVQQGHTFHSMQPLNQEQLKQIATVLQQRQFDASAAAANSKKIVYDAETNTRIIYRVVYPEDFDLHEPKSPAETSTAPRGRGRRGRPPKSAMRGPGRRISGSEMEGQDDRATPDVSKGERDERKKHLPRTRSGRLSRPPRHMIRDYKRLHHLDFSEPDLDDSDGGYSDYQISDHEREEDTEATRKEIPELTVKKRNISDHFRCPTCHKIYLGHRRMARHFEMYPDHGSVENLPKPEDTASQKKQIAEGEADAKVGIEITAECASGHNSPMLTPNVNGIVRHGPPYRRRGRRRGPWAYVTPEARSERRKSKLRELMATCEPRELVEVVGPEIARSLTFWDLMLLRVEAVQSQDTRLATLCSELKPLLEKMHDVVQEILLTSSTSDNKGHTIKISDEEIAKIVGVPCGTYYLDESDDQKLRFQTSTLEKVDDSEVGLQETTSMHTGETNSEIINESQSSGDHSNDAELYTPPVKRVRFKNEHDPVFEENLNDNSNSSTDNRSNVNFILGTCDIPPKEKSVNDKLSSIVEQVNIIEDDPKLKTSIDAVGELIAEQIKKIKKEKSLVLNMAASPSKSVTNSSTVDRIASVSGEISCPNFGDLQQFASPRARVENSTGISNSSSFESPNVLSVAESSDISKLVNSQSNPTHALDGISPQKILEEELKNTSATPTNSKTSINFQFPGERSIDMDLATSTIEVSLDTNIESASELDFEALSEELNRNTQS